MFVREDQDSSCEYVKFGLPIGHLLDSGDLLVIKQV